MSCLSNSIIIFSELFKKNLVRTVDPIKKPANAITNVITRLCDGLFKDSSKNMANRKSTINGWNR